MCRSSRSSLFLSLLWMGGSAGRRWWFCRRKIRIFDNRKVLQIVCPFALAAETQFLFFFVKSRIAISVSLTAVLRRRGWSSMCAEDWTPPTGSLPTSSPSPLLYLLLPPPFFSLCCLSTLPMLSVCMYACMHAWGSFFSVLWMICLEP